MVLTSVFGWTALLVIVLTRNCMATGKCTFCREDNIGVFFSVFDIELIHRPYEVQDFLPLVSKISEEFKMIAVNLRYDKNDSINKIPLAVATWNAESSYSSLSRILETIIVLESMDGEDMCSFREIIFEANKIYPNTVSTILHSLPLEANHRMPKTFRNFAKERKKCFTDHKFKHGLLIDEFNFPQKHKRSTAWLNVDPVDYVYLTITAESDEVYMPMEDIAKLKINPLLNNPVLQNIQHNIISNSSFCLIGEYNIDISQQRTFDYLKLLQFWNSIVAYGNSKNATVLIKQAFNHPSLDSQAGWWSLVDDKNGNYTSTSDLIYEDATSLAEKEMKPEQLLNQIKNSVQFDNNFIVHFNPYALLQYGNASNHSITLYDSLDKIITKFRGLSINIGKYFEALNYKAAFQIPKLLLGHQFEYGPLELCLFFDIEHLKNNEYFVRRNLRKAVKMSKSPIKQILVGVKNSDFHLLNEMNNNFTLQNVLDVKIRCVCLINECISIINEETMGYVDIIYCKITGLKATYYGGVYQVILETLRQFDHFKRLVNDVSPGKLVGLVTSYFDPDEPVNNKYISLSIFWKELNAWATETNTKVIMEEAFDPHHELHENISYSGWWKLRPPNNTINGSIFEEKQSIAIETLQNLLAKPKPIDTKVNWLLPILMTSLVVFLITASLVVCCIHRKRSKRNDLLESCKIEICNENVIVLHQSAFVPETSVMVGSGNFGEVYKCFMSQFESIVAVKTVRNGKFFLSDAVPNNVKSLLSEIKIMSCIGHHENVLRLLGVCQENALFIVTEFCENGSLLSFLRSQLCQKVVPSNYQLLQFCMEIANGMQFLESFGIIHGDLSARNVLLNGQNACKISDFGLSRKLADYEMYMKKGGEPLPWRWMALESLLRFEFSSKSDVWSMGVTFWEVFTMGKTPFPEMMWNDTFCDELTNGLRLTKPVLADENVYAIMMSCWEVDAASRPSPIELACKFKELKNLEYAVI